MITNGRDGGPQRSSDDGRESAPGPLAEALGPRLGPAATFATTEHFNLQTARATTVSEANGRASIYLAALSSNLIALAFIGQVSRLGPAFYAFALILLPVLAFVGLVTFVRFGSVVERGDRLRPSHRGSAHLLPASLARARAVPRDPPGDALRTQRLAAHPDGRRDGRGDQQCRAGGVRRPRARGGGRHLPCDSAGVRSTNRSWCLLVARTPPSPRAQHLQPRGRRSGSDPRLTTAARADRVCLGTPFRPSGTGWVNPDAASQGDLPRYRYLPPPEAVRPQRCRRRQAAEGSSMTPHRSCDRGQAALCSRAMHATNKLLRLWVLACCAAASASS
jgi:hypothetical protein